MAIRLKMAVRVSRLGHRRVPELLLYTPQIRPIAQEPCRIGVAGRMVLAVGKPGLAQERLPDALHGIGQAVPVNQFARPSESQPDLR